MNKPQIKIHFGIQFDLEQPLNEIKDLYSRLKKSKVVKHIFTKQIPKNEILEEYYQISITLNDNWMHSFDLEEALDIFLNEIDVNKLADISNQFEGSTILYIAAMPSLDVYPSLTISSNQLKTFNKFYEFSLDIEIYN